MQIDQNRSASQAVSQCVRRSWRLVMLCSALLLAPVVQAKDMKIAVLDYGAAMLKSDRAKKMADVIKKDLEKRESIIRNLEQEIKSMTEKAERDGPVLSDSDKFNLTKEVRDKQEEYRNQLEKYQKTQKDGRDDIVRALRPKMAEIVEGVVKKGGYDLVVERGGVVHVDEKYDITDKVVKALNETLKKEKAK